MAKLLPVTAEHSATWVNPDQIIMIYQQDKDIVIQLRDEVKLVINDGTSDELAAFLNGMQSR